MKRTPLKRNKPLSTDRAKTLAWVKESRKSSTLSGGGGVLKRSTKLAPISKKRKLQLAEYRSLRATYFAQNPLCCWPGCRRLATELHHARGRENERLNDVRFFRGLCNEHHRLAHSDPKAAKKVGVSVSRLWEEEETP